DGALTCKERDHWRLGHDTATALVDRGDESLPVLDAGANGFIAYHSGDAREVLSSRPDTDCDQGHGSQIARPAALCGNGSRQHHHRRGIHVHYLTREYRSR